MVSSPRAMSQAMRTSASSSSLILSTLAATTDSRINAASKNGRRKFTSSTRIRPLDVATARARRIVAREVAPRCPSVPK